MSRILLSTTILLWSCASAATTGVDVVDLPISDLGVRILHLHSGLRILTITQQLQRIQRMVFCQQALHAIKNLPGAPTIPGLDGRLWQEIRFLVVNQLMKFRDLNDFSHERNTHLGGVACLKVRIQRKKRVFCALLSSLLMEPQRKVYPWFCRLQQPPLQMFIRLSGPSFPCRIADILDLCSLFVSVFPLSLESLTY